MTPNLQIPDTPSGKPAGDTTPHPDAELIELERALKFAPEEARKVDAAFDEAAKVAYAETPECPVKIKYRGRGRRGEDVYRPMTRDDIDRIHDNNRLFYGDAKADEFRANRLRLLEEHEAEREAIRQRHNLPALSDASDAAWGRVSGLEDRIITEPAFSSDGLAIKRRVAEQMLEDADFDFEWPKNLIRSLFDDAGRFAGLGSLVDAEDPFVRLWSERVAQMAEADELARASKDPETDEADERRIDIDREIEAVPARSLFGILIKLRVFMSIEEIAEETFFGGEKQALNERLFRGALADLERLVGRAS
jgi:hypothetical protein